MGETRKLPSWTDLKRQRRVMESEAKGLLANHPEITREKILSEMTPEEIQLVALLPAGTLEKVLDKLGIPES